MNRAHMKNKGGKYISSASRQSSRISVILTSAIFLLMIVGGIYLFGSGKEPSSAHSDSKESMAKVPSTYVSREQESTREAFVDPDKQMQEELRRREEEQRLQAMEQYDSILRKYLTAVSQGWDPMRCEDEEISYMIAFLESADDLGYMLEDLDGNGQLELIVSDGDIIFDLFTLTQEGSHRILTGGERNVYYLCEGNSIYNRGSNSAFSSQYNFYLLNGTELVTQKAILFDAEVDSGENWFVVETEQNTEKLFPLSEEASSDLIASYKIVPIEITSVTSLLNCDH